MSKYSQYGIFSEQLTALGFGFVTDMAPTENEEYSLFAFFQLFVFREE